MELELGEVELNERLILYTALMREYGKPSAGNIDNFLNNFFSRIVGGSFAISNDTLATLDSIKHVQNTGGKQFINYIAKINEYVPKDIEIKEAFALVKRLIQEYEPVEDMIQIIKLDSTEYSLREHIEAAKEMLSNIIELPLMHNGTALDSTVILVDETLDILGLGTVESITDVEVNLGLFDLTHNKMLSQPGDIMSIKLIGTIHTRLKQGSVINRITQITKDNLANIVVQ